MSAYDNWINSGRGNVTFYFPMTDSSTAHVNSAGTGDMTPNGVIENADVGANQLQCKASEFDGVSDYVGLFGSGIVGSVASKIMTLSLVIKDKDNNSDYVLDIYKGGSSPRLRVSVNSNDSILVEGFNSSNTKILNAVTPSGSSPQGREAHISLEIDMSNSANRAFILNGVDIESSVSWFAYTDDLLDFSSTVFCRIGVDRNQTAYFNGSTGEVFFNVANYLNIKTSNIFWNAETNKPKPLVQVLAETGLNPLIAHSMSADNLTTDLVGNSWTVNGSPTGARGSTEYIARGLIVDGTNYLTGSIFCQSLVKWKSLDGGATWTVTYSNAETVTNIGNGTDNGVVAYYFGFSDNITWTETTQNLVTNQLGYPREPSQVILDSGWTPVLGLFFDDNANVGKNDYGTDYTPTGTPLNGADVKR